MPDDCGLKPPIETLPQIAQERAMVVLRKGFIGRLGGAGRAERGGMIARGLRPPSSNVDRITRSREEGSSRQEVALHVSNQRTPGRLMVTRRAIADLVRAAVLGSYGVTGFSGGPIERLLGGLGAGEPGLRILLEPGLEVDLDITVAYGLPIAEVARQVESAVRYSIRKSLGRELDRLTIHVDGLRVHPGSAPESTVSQQPSVTLDDLAESGTDVA